ncbi:hypothetical protein E2C01_021081 [Portunus trituberculatus]|uniref:Uncharacterized protein n=1 Tax=Portunus trituberculatus TaxID=210409 RepID=A0A5B7E1J7_PORTR|nr:hypothetical protein [Portunus trituberculatus]
MSQEDGNTEADNLSKPFITYKSLSTATFDRLWRIIALHYDTISRPSEHHQRSSSEQHLSK